MRPDESDRVQRVNWRLYRSAVAGHRGVAGIVRPPTPRGYDAGTDAFA
jgi:hypothetical protein